MGHKMMMMAMMVVMMVMMIMMSIMMAEEAAAAKGWPRQEQTSTFKDNVVRGRIFFALKVSPS